MPRKHMHPTFQRKRVVQLECSFCGNWVCHRGMKAILLADTKVELYSTDFPANNGVEPIGDSYSTEKCSCRIKDIACLGCGNVVGYSVVQPCKPCLQSCNNGHFWMFHSNVVDASDRIDRTGCEVLRWGSLPENAEDECLTSTFTDDLEECCR